MAYVAHEFYYDGTRATLWGYIQVAMINFGWELWDNISATVKVYRSNGESGKEPYGYVWFDAGTSTYIQINPYQYWNNATHTGIRLRYASDTAGYNRITYMSQTYACFIGGDKDFVLIAGDTFQCNVGSFVLFGHLPVRFDNNLTAAQGTAGTAGTITIASSSGMGIGKKIQIAGAEGCDSLSISAAPDATTRLVTALPRNYGTSAVVGSPASVFGIVSSNTAFWYPVSIWGDSGTAGTSSGNWAVSTITGPALYSTFFWQQQKYTLTPFLVYNLTAAFPGAMVGSFGINLMAGVSVQAGDTMLTNNDDSFPVVSSVTGITDNTLSDSSKSWVVNEHAGRLCIISFGPGAGAVKRILSNTANVLTMDSNWPVLVDSLHFGYPNIGSEYKICDKIYRGMSGLFSNGYILITRTDVPS